MEYFEKSNNIFNHSGEILVIDDFDVARRICDAIFSMIEEIDDENI